MEGIFVEMDRRGGGVLTHQRQSCAYCQYSNLPAHLYRLISLSFFGGWSGGAMVLGKLPVLGRPAILITVGQGPTALAVGAGGGCLDIFSFIFLPVFGRRPDID